MEVNKKIFDKYNTLESKSWFRLVKVIYVSLAVLVLVIGCFILWEEKPYRAVDNEKSYIQCDRDVKAELIYTLDKNGWSQWGRVYGDEATLSYYDVQSIIQTCAAPLDEITGKPVTSYVPVVERKLFPTPNYKFYPVLKTEGSYFDWIKSYLTFFVIFAIAFKVIVELFYYVVTGKRMFKNIIYYYPDE